MVQTCQTKRLADGTVAGIEQQASSVGANDVLVGHTRTHRYGLNVRYRPEAD